jgi:hypothetical protein
MSAEHARRMPDRLRVVPSQETCSDDEPCRKFESIDEAMNNADTIADDKYIEELFRRIDDDSDFASKMCLNLAYDDKGKVGSFFSDPEIGKRGKASPLEHVKQVRVLEVQNLLEDYLDGAEAGSAAMSLDEYMGEEGDDRRAVKIAFVDKDRNLRQQTFRGENFDDHEALVGQYPLLTLENKLIQDYDLDSSNQDTLGKVVKILEVAKSLEDKDSAKKKAKDRFQKL